MYYVLICTKCIKNIFSMAPNPTISARLKPVIIHPENNYVVLKFSTKLCDK